VTGGLNIEVREGRCRRCGKPGQIWNLPGEPGICMACVDVEIDAMGKGRGHVAKKKAAQRDGEPEQTPLGRMRAQLAGIRGALGSLGGDILDYSEDVSGSEDLAQALADAKKRAESALKRMGALDQALLAAIGAASEAPVSEQTRLADGADVHEG